ncbi:MAG TPA: tRNA (adenosine(37)-N6)-threonylcarbamoyltransferase complex transferase subunit TsaD [Polyangiaceae bacterium]|nr:tRNA (adenosine(37)-N6)-threonylcarbamoyltransferase complex transferase subunit TsaD [Polyangiaceae bacterium]
MLVLGIETSCDETAAAVVDENGRVLSDVVHTQIAVHRPYGGVVPELASRDHLRNAEPVIVKALADAGVRLDDVSGVAVTCRPGLTGALLVGVQIAQGLAWAAGKPVVGIDHLVGHICAAYLERPGVKLDRPAPPFVALIASGGHTALYRVDGLESGAIRELGATRDDAAGEAFDKVAKLLGLGYPGGPVIDRLAKAGDATRFAIAPPMPERDSLEFSFSGIKTNVARWVEKNGVPSDEAALSDLCAAFQRRVVDALVRKTMVAARRERVSTVVLGGGVAANRELRAAMANAGAVRELSVVVPEVASCTDNAAMIAFAGVARLAKGEDDTGRLEVNPATSLPRVTRKGRGRR